MDWQWQKTISNPPEKSFQNTQFGGTKFGLKRVTGNFSKKFVPMDWILRCLTMRHIFTIFPEDFEQTRVFLKTSCSPRDPPRDLQNVKNSPEPPLPHTPPKWA